MARQSKSVTIQDVARLVGCSTQTVSRVVNGSPSVRQSTRERVLQGIEQLDYHPNIWARNLQRRRVDSIGLSIPFSTEQIRRNPFFAEIISSVSNECSESQMGLNVVSYDKDQEGTDLLIRMHRQKVISGLILTCPGMDPECISLLKHKGVPLVVIGRPTAGVNVSYVDGNNARIAYDCTRHLLNLGHRRVALINGPSSMTYSEDLYQGYIRALSERGISRERGVAVETNLLEDDAELKARELISRRPPVTACVAANGHLALGLIRSLREAGRGVPEDVSVIACSSSEYDQYAYPPISSVRMDYSRLAQIAFQILMRAIAEVPPNPEQVILPGQIVERDSCRPFVVR